MKSRRPGQQQLLHGGYYPSMRAIVFDEIPLLDSTTSINGRLFGTISGFLSSSRISRFPIFFPLVFFLIFYNWLRNTPFGAKYNDRFSSGRLQVVVGWVGWWEGREKQKSSCLRLVF